jgi:hypothetical protein
MLRREPDADEDLFRDAAADYAKRAEVADILRAAKVLVTPRPERDWASSFGPVRALEARVGLRAVDLARCDRMGPLRQGVVASLAAVSERVLGGGVVEVRFDWLPWTHEIPGHPYRSVDLESVPDELLREAVNAYLRETGEHVEVHELHVDTTLRRARYHGSAWAETLVRVLSRLLDGVQYRVERFTLPPPPP